MPASSNFHSPMTDPVMRLQLHCIPSFQSGYPAERTVTLETSFRPGTSLDIYVSCLHILFIVDIIGCTFPCTFSFTVACSGLTPISEISTRAFVAYSWFGPPLCPFAGVY